MTTMLFAPPARVATSYVPFGGRVAMVEGLPVLVTPESFKGFKRRKFAPVLHNYSQEQLRSIYREWVAKKGLRNVRVGMAVDLSSGAPRSDWHTVGLFSVWIRGYKAERPSKEEIRAMLGLDESRSAPAETVPRRRPRLTWPRRPIAS